MNDGEKTIPGTYDSGLYEVLERRRYHGVHYVVSATPNFTLE